jgi:hypothetical protein
MRNQEKTAFPRGLGDLGANRQSFPREGFFTQAAQFAKAVMKRGLRLGGFSSILPRLSKSFAVPLSTLTIVRPAGLA